MSDIGARPAEADAFGKVEAHGIEAIPAADRHGRPRELAFLWAGAFVNYASLFTASLLTTYYGLGVWDGLVATALGTVAAAVILGLLSNTGPRSGLPQIAFTRSIFGLRGSYVGAALTLFLAIGWFAVDCVIAAQAGAQLFGGGNSAATFGLVLFIAAISVAVAIFGHQTIKVLETYGAVTFALLSAALFVFLAPQFHWTQGPAASGSDYAGAFVLGFMTCFALVASWYPFASDYSRYLPAASPTRAVTLWPVAGIAIPMVLLGLFGLLLPTIDAGLAQNQGVLAVITAHAPPWIAIPFFVFIIVGEIWANYLDVYTAGLSGLALNLRMQRWTAALLLGCVGGVLAYFAMFISNFKEQYTNFLLITYLWVPSWAAVVLVDQFILRRHQPAPGLVSWRAVAAWLVGVVVAVPFVDSTLWQSPLAVNLLHNTDISGYVGALVGGGVYLMLGRRA